MEKRRKLSFSIPSKARTPARVAAGVRSSDDGRDSAPAPQFITVFETSQTLTPEVEPAVVLPPLSNSVRFPSHRSREPTDASSGLTPEVDPAVIAPLPNSVRFSNHQSHKPTDASSGAGTTNPVLDTSKAPENPSSTHTSYGLILRNTAAAESASAATDPAASRAAADNIMLRRYKDDMALLPDQPGEEEYDEVPVEGFGAALLAGYGWKEGDAIGRNGAKQKEAKVVQYDRRTGSQGLGFEPSKKRDRERRDQTQDDPNARDSRQARSVSGGNYKVPCLHSHIRVRVVSKNMSKRLYMMKGRVVDVTGPTTCDIVMDDGTEVVQGVEQDMLETVLPPMNGHVLVLCRKHKGAYGRLVEMNSDEQTGVLEDADTRDMIRVDLDKIAEYVGDPELIGY